jgi:hypothetical protein
MAISLHVFVLFAYYNCALEEMGGPSHADAGKTLSLFAASQQFDGRAAISPGWPGSLLCCVTNTMIAIKRW